MPNSWKMLLPLAAFTSAAPAVAAPQQAGITYDCDTAANHLSELVLPAPGGSFTVSGHVQINQVPPIDRYVPVARLTIAQAGTAPGQASSDLAGFSLTAVPGKSVNPKVQDDKLVVQYLTWDEKAGGVSKAHAPFGIAAMGGKLDFSLTFASGTVTGRIAGQEQRFSLRAQNPVVRVVCSTGEFLFTDLKIERPG